MNCAKGFTIFYSRLAVMHMKGTNFKMHLPKINGHGASIWCLGLRLYNNNFNEN